MLHALMKYRQDLEAEPGFAAKDVRWAVCFSKEGDYQGVVELGDTAQKRNRGRRFDKCPELTQPELIAGGESRSHFLVERAEVVALLGRDRTEEKLVRKHAFFIRLLREAASAMPILARVADTLSNEDCLSQIRRALEEKKARPTDKVTIRVGDVFPVESSDWHEWWRSFRTRLSTGKPSAACMLSFLSGRLVQPARTHPKIRGLADVDGSPTGDVLVGFDKEAFCSYGLEQSANAAISEEEAKAYVDRLNDLIGDPGHSASLAGAKVVHWFKQKVQSAEDPLAWLEEGAEEQEMQAQERARKLLESLRAGERPDLADNEFYALTISGVGGRVMVRDWMEGRFERLVANINRWFDDLSIVRGDGQGLARSPKFLAVVGATVRELKDLPPPFVAKMWRAAVLAEPIPAAALAKALERARVEVLDPNTPLQSCPHGFDEGLPPAKALERRSAINARPQTNPQRGPPQSCLPLRETDGGVRSTAKKRPGRRRSRCGPALLRRRQQHPLPGAWAAVSS